MNKCTSKNNLDTHIFKISSEKIKKDEPNNKFYTRRSQIKPVRIKVQTKKSSNTFILATNKIQAKIDTRSNIFSLYIPQILVFTTFTPVNPLSIFFFQIYQLILSIIIYKSLQFETNKTKSNTMCTNHKNWDLIKQLDEEYIQNNWVWYSNEVRQLCGCTKTNLTNIKAFIYSTPENNPEVLKTKKKSFVFMKRNNKCGNLLVRLFKIKNYETYVCDEVSNVYDGVLYLFCTMFT